MVDVKKVTKVKGDAKKKETPDVNWYYVVPAVLVVAAVGIIAAKLNGRAQ